VLCSVLVLLDHAFQLEFQVGDHFRQVCHLLEFVVSLFSELLSVSDETVHHLLQLYHVVTACHTIVTVPLPRRHCTTSSLHAIPSSLYHYHVVTVPRRHCMSYHSHCTTTTSSLTVCHTVVTVPRRHCMPYHSHCTTTTSSLYHVVTAHSHTVSVVPITF